MKKFGLILLFGITSVLFFSCKNFFGGNQLKKEYSISGKVLEGDFSKEDADSKRSAFPENTNNYYYKITATDAANSEKTVVTESSSSDSSFILKIPYAGVWNITAEGFLDSARTQKLLKTTKTVRVSVSDENPSGYAEMVLLPFASTEGNGGVNLEFLLPGTARPIEKIVCECIFATKSGAKDVFSTKFSEISALTVSENKAQLNLTGLPSASYTVNFYFYGNASGGDVLYYCATQILNVYDNFTCTNWIKHGEEEYLVEESESTVFKVTDELTEAFLLSAVYVDGLDGNDSNSGTWISPVKTLDMAFALYNVTGSKVSTIFVKGDSTNSVVAAQPLTVTKNLSIKKNPLAENTPVILFKGEAANPITSSCFTVGSGKTLEISGIEIKAGENVAIAQNGGAFFVSGNLSLKNITISDFKLTDNTKNGGAIFVNSTGSLSIGGDNHISTNKKNALSEGNFVNSNIYLSTGKKINITGDLTGSEIGISLQNENTVTPLVQVVFTQNFSVKNEQSPFRCFVSDTDYIAGYDKDYVAGGTGEAVLAISGGTLGWENTNKNLKIYLSSNVYHSGFSKDISVLIKIPDDTASENDIAILPSDVTSYSYVLQTRGTVVTQGESTYKVSSAETPNILTFSENLFPGVYNLFVQIVYDGTVYSAEFQIDGKEKIENYEDVMDIINCSKASELEIPMNDFTVNYIYSPDLSDFKGIEIPTGKTVLIKSKGIEPTTIFIQRADRAYYPSLFLVKGKLILENVIIDGNQKYAHRGSIMVSGGELVMNDVVLKNWITGGATEYYTAISIMNGGKVTFNSGEISLNKPLYDNYYSGIYVDSGTFIMNGGIITGHSSTKTDGGAITLVNGTFEMYDGKIYGNDCGSYQVYCRDGTTFIKNGGEIIGDVYYP